LRTLSSGLHSIARALKTGSSNSFLIKIDIYDPLASLSYLLLSIDEHDHACRGRGRVSTRSRLAVCDVVWEPASSRADSRGRGTRRGRLPEREIRRRLRGALEEGGHRRLKGEGREVARAKTEWTRGRENRQERPCPGAAR